MDYFKLKSHAKVNLSLNVLGKWKSLHRIQSLVSFLDLHDEIKIKKINNKNYKIKFVGKFSKKIKSKNTISQLLKILENKKFLQNKYEIIVHKNVPSEAGLGGGSMNAACIVNFFVKKNLIKIKKNEIVKLCNLIGSDVVLGLYSKSLVFRSNKKIKTFSVKKKLYTLIVKPNFGCSTKKIYSKVKKFSKPNIKLNSNKLFSIKFLKKMKNDLEIVSLKEYPKLKIIKNFLEDLPQTQFVRMTGSGSAMIAYFNSVRFCKDAEKKVKNKFKNYWCKTSKTI